MRILIISATFPYPPSLGGTQVRTFYLLKYLAQHHSVTLVTQRSRSVTDRDLYRLGTYVNQLVTFPQPTGADLQPGLGGKISRFGQFLGTGTPPSTQFLHQSAMQRWIDSWVIAGGDAITCEHSVNEVFVRPQYRYRIPKVVVNIHSSIYGTLVNQLATGTAEKPIRDRINRYLMGRYERRYVQKFSDLVVTTPEDHQFFQPIPNNAGLHVVPNGVDLAQFPYRLEDPGGHRLVFVGAMDTLANGHTARYLGRKVLPRLRSRYPDCSLYLVGRNPTAAVRDLAQRSGVTVTGAVHSVVDYLHRATVCVVPMRVGFGIKNKTLEAMAAGVPVVGSDRGLEGLSVDRPLAALRANSLRDTVAAISQLFEQPHLRATLSKNGRHLVETSFTWEQAGQAYEQILASDLGGFSNLRGLNGDRR